MRLWNLRCKLLTLLEFEEDLATKFAWSRPPFIIDISQQSLVTFVVVEHSRTAAISPHDE